MSFSYSGDPSASSLDEVRFLIGDTDSADFEIHDAEVNYALSVESNNARLAAARILRALATKFAKLVDKAVGDLKISYSQRSKQYMELADELEDAELNPLTGVTPTIYVGGISVSDKDSVEEDSDRVNPSFRRGMHDNPAESDEGRDICNRNR